MKISEDKAREIFKNMADYLADTRIIKEGRTMGEDEFEEGKTIKAMTEDKFIEALNSIGLLTLEKRTNTLLNAIKNKKVKEWFYEFAHGHPFLVNEEADIICETRFNDKYKWMNDTEVQELVRIKVKAMYKVKFPKAKRWSLPIF